MILKSSCRPKIDFSSQTPKNHLQEISVVFYKVNMVTQRESIENTKKAKMSLAVKTWRDSIKLKNFGSPLFCLKYNFFIFFIFCFFQKFFKIIFIIYINSKVFINLYEVFLFKNNIVNYT